MRKHLRLEVYRDLLVGLGPWANPASTAPDVTRRTMVVPPVRTGDRPFDAVIVRPTHREPSGALLVCPGLHYDGPNDPRLLRFLDQLATAGIMVLSPFLPDYTALRVDPRVVGDLDRAFHALYTDPSRPRGIRPGIFSISFGSLPSLKVAAQRSDVGAVVVFGGYADFARTIRFALGFGETGHAVVHDPLSQPVVFMNIAEELLPDEETRREVVEAWTRFVRATWGRPEMKVLERYAPIAREIASGLSPGAQAMFLAGCAVDTTREQAFARCEEALVKAQARFAFLDPRPSLATIRCPVTFVHGADDDVIPMSELNALYEAMPAGARTQRFLTGLYAHTGASPNGVGSGPAAPLARLSQAMKKAPLLAKEGRALMGILDAVVAASRARG